MKNPADRLAADFRCPKCQGRQAATKEANLGSVAERLAPGGTSGRYLLVSCSLCGYTEVYNLRILESAAERESVKRGVREPAR